MTIKTTKVKIKQSTKKLSSFEFNFFRQIKQNIANAMRTKFSINGGIKSKLFTSLSQGFVKTLRSASGTARMSDHKVGAR
jgi:hypothetical protein